MAWIIFGWSQTICNLWWYWIMWLLCAVPQRSHISPTLFLVFVNVIVEKLGDGIFIFFIVCWLLEIGKNYWINIGHPYFAGFSQQSSYTVWKKFIIVEPEQVQYKYLFDGWEKCTVILIKTNCLFIGDNIFSSNKVGSMTLDQQKCIPRA